MGASKKVMPDTVKILEPKDQDDNVTPHVVSSIQQEEQAQQAQQ
jgi:hypothetical protein